MENLQKILSEIIADFIPDFISIEDISRLSGRSSNESWKITLNTRENKKIKPWINNTRMEINIR